MDASRQEQQLARFEAWLSRKPMKAPAGLLSRVRQRVEAGEDGIDRVLDGLLQPDPSLGNPWMAARIRRKMRAEQRDRLWVRRLAPLAAAATLALAFLSFQTRAPSPAGTKLPETGLARLEESLSSADAETTRIMALAANLQGGTHLGNLDAIEDLAFLFD
ncbi:MAG: hypothetical protein ACP5I4_09725 [Oceanipulchritudo sp.]